METKHATYRKQYWIWIDCFYNTNILETTASKIEEFSPLESKNKICTLHLNLEKIIISRTNYTFSWISESLY